MARIEIDPNYTSPTFSRATAAADIFKKEDVQALAAAVSTHDHSTGKGATLSAGAIPTGSITSAMIANGTIVAADIAPGTITSNEIADGTIATADLANASVTNAKLASDTARVSLLTNGGMEVWQRGNGPFSTASAWTADRWQLAVLGGGSTCSISASSTVDIGSGAAMAITYTHGNNTLIQQKVEDVAALRGKTISVSVRVNASAASAVMALVSFTTNPGSNTYSSAHPGGSTWQTLTVTVAVPANETAVFVSIYLQASVTAYVDNAMLVVGSVPADYMPRPFGDELARCQRYYEVNGNYLAFGGYAAAGGQVIQPFQYRAQKPVAPTVTKNGATWTISNCGQPVVTAFGVYGFGLHVIVTALGAFVTATTATDNVTSEANP